MNFYQEAQTEVTAGGRLMARRNSVNTQLNGGLHKTVPSSLLLDIKIPSADE
jgi:hypothetical protein